MVDFLKLKKNLKKDFSKFQIVKIAILGDNATQLFAQALKGYGYEISINFDIFEADYNQIDLQIFDRSSEFYKFKPEFAVLACSSQKLLKKFYKLNDVQKAVFASEQINKIESEVKTILDNHPCRVIYFNYTESDDNIYGNYSNKVKESWLYQIRKINLDLMNLSQDICNLFINDICSLQHQYGRRFVHDAKFYVNADMVFSVDSLPIIAKNVTDIVLAVNGKLKKCLILDLDNLLWGGVIGDDGVNGIELGDLGIGKVFVELQEWIKQLKDRGIILAVCSKNDEDNAKEPFEKHPDMVLKLDDIAVFVSNWENKSENIKHIQAVLNIGFDSMVFLDDNPFEREIVHSFIPDISIPDLPEDPSEYLDFIKSCNFFETASHSSNDSNRTKQYQQEAKRKGIQKNFANEDEFLASLGMQSDVKEFDEFTIPRIAQLTQRSNQFNLRTIRYSEDDIRRISESKDHHGLSFTLEDKFGDYGLISVVILENRGKELFVDTWIMSCRVLKRGVEKFVFNQVLKYAQTNGCQRIVGEYIPTAKNSIAKNLYEDLGFSCESGYWYVDVKGSDMKANLIKHNVNCI
ncbi:MAG: hypothetical protein A2Y03_05185 [Omnitrophica WOR_2 bacterium GWF2_38_59]|nr:MAG: hypothetical protein A2Y03_05185 [Omnitrophica WOR_2 bacterium GWF2_38_59]OGX48294.1 MAG: hypothetical protein A2243_10105 [Omnitrophica WOR_2 bacterium RIFOXYA2_FULL_38_17]OGX59637.1 MAG: hypothetical protein A2447_12195 [Omnitrophica WOR_2 bacterium RIFOXYC2_FULL_38_12]OGX60030.1 MAG: hypothetical protein A2306_04730 [Omnitrophica WOR_2 bacterium RIFOXYB2_FULL_38_16]